MSKKLIAIKVRCESKMTTEHNGKKACTDSVFQIWDILICQLRFWLVRNHKKNWILENYVSFLQTAKSRSKSTICPYYRITNPTALSTEMPRDEGQNRRLSFEIILKLPGNALFDNSQVVQISLFSKNWRFGIWRKSRCRYRRCRYRRCRYE
jgi:hypothetical protein